MPQLPWMQLVAGLTATRPCSGQVGRLRIVSVEPSPRLDASSWKQSGEEPDGLSAHRWLERPGDSRLWLFKAVEIKAGNRQGEDWAEKSVAEIGGLLGIPCAPIELAIRSGQEGLISRDIKPKHWDLQPGAALLGGFVPGYDSQAKFRDGHSLANVALALRDLGAPAGYDGVASMNAYDTFCGYLLLDALVANRDRHDHNWAVLIPPGSGQLLLAPSFDHASGLGFGLSDDKRLDLVKRGEVGRWVLRGTAWRFEYRQGSQAQSLVELATSALRAATRAARAEWQDRFSRLSLDAVSDLLMRIQVMSVPAVTFAGELIRLNHERLLAAWDEEGG